MAESAFTRDTCKGLVRGGCRVIVISGNRFVRHQPDRLVWSMYGKWLIEFKDVTTKTKVAQTAVLKDLHGVSNWSAFVARACPGLGRGGGILTTWDETHVLCGFNSGEELLKELKRIEKWAVENALRPLST